MSVRSSLAMSRILAWVLAAGLVTAGTGTASGAPSLAAGSFRDLLSRRVSVAPVRGGQAFAVALTGPSVVAGPFALKVPGGKGPLTLGFEAPVLEAGRFSSPVRLSNGSGLPLSGLRLDVTGVSMSEPASGGPVRDLGNGGASPLWFGELAVGQESAPALLQVDLDVPEGTKGTFVIMGVVTGVSVVEDLEAGAEADRTFRARQKARPECAAEVLESVRGEGFGQAAGPTGCRTDPDGTVWVVDGSGDPLKLFDSRSGFVRALGPAAGAGASDVAFGSGGRVFVYEAGERPGTGILIRTLRPF